MYLQSYQHFSDVLLQMGYSGTIHTGGGGGGGICLTQNCFAEFDTFELRENIFKI